MAVKLQNILLNFSHLYGFEIIFNDFFFEFISPVYVQNVLVNLRVHICWMIIINTYRIICLKKSEQKMILHVKTQETRNHDHKLQIQFQTNDTLFMMISPCQLP